MKILIGTVSSAALAIACPYLVFRYFDYARSDL